MDGVLHVRVWFLLAHWEVKLSYLGGGYLRFDVMGDLVYVCRSFLCVFTSHSIITRFSSFGEGPEMMKNGDQEALWHLLEESQK